jgi:adenine deaminase
MEKNELKKLIDTAAGRIPADVVIRGARIVDVFGGGILEGDIAVSDGIIAGIGDYDGKEIIEATGLYAVPGFIDGHIHIESSYVSPEEIGRLLVPHGATTIIADPHEIVNVCGLTGLEYMMDAATETALDIKFMLPSCVPATPFENSGAVIDAKAMEKPILDDRIIGLGEFMNYPGVIGAYESVLDKLMVAKRAGKHIDGHSPAITGKDLNAYASALIRTDHECSTVEEMHERISRGIYVLMRQGSTCHDLRNLLKGVSSENSRRCLLCSDDRQPKTMLELGHIDDHLRICIEEGLDAVAAIRMASLNAAECFRLHDRGAIAPGLRADIVLLEDLRDFKVRNVFIKGMEVARDGAYLPPVRRRDIKAVTGSFNVKDFSIDKLRIPLKTDRAHVIFVRPGSVVTDKLIEKVVRDPLGCFLFDHALDIAKIAVVERHKGTGNVATGLLKGYGIKQGALAISIAHDAHNIITVGTNDADMAFAVEELVRQSGGVVMVLGGKVLECMPMPIGGIMSDKSGEWVDERLVKLHEIAHARLGINNDIEPIMSLCFMSLMVIPEIKLTDMGLFDVTKFDFISLDADED